jgi:hypothetical protein
MREVNVRPGEIRQIGRVRRRARASPRTPKLPFGSHDMQEFFYCELTWARAARVAAGTRDAARSARFRTGQSPSAAGAAGGTEGLGVTLSLCRHSRMPRHLTARVDSMRQTTTRARRREDEMARPAHGTLWRKRGGCTRSPLSFSRRVRRVPVPILHHAA